MKAFKNAMMILVGAAGGIAVVLSCGGDDSAVPDAAAGDATTRCDCPQPEPIERRIRLVSNDGISVGDEAELLFVGCGVGGAVALGGTCDSGATAAENLQLKSIRTGSDGWSCTWLNPNRLVGVKAKVTAICLFPEGTPFPDAGL